MKHLLYSLLMVLLFTACKKSNATTESTSKVDIYMLKSYSVNVDQTGTPSIVSISNAVLADTPLVADPDIKMYTQSSTTFTLTKNIKPIIQNYGADKAFAITVNKQPVYFGVFRPAYLNSLVFGVASIDPIIFTTESELSIQYAMFAGNPYLPQLDKRNDDRIINTLRLTGRAQ